MYRTGSQKLQELKGRFRRRVGHNRPVRLWLSLFNFLSHNSSTLAFQIRLAGMSAQDSSFNLPANISSDMFAIGAVSSVAFSLKDGWLLVSESAEVGGVGKGSGEVSEPMSRF